MIKLALIMLFLLSAAGLFYFIAYPLLILFNEREKASKMTDIFFYLFLIIAAIVILLDIVDNFGDKLF